MITSREVLIERIGAAVDACAAEFNSMEYKTCRFARKGVLYFMPESESFVVSPCKPKDWSSEWPFPVGEVWVDCGSLSEDEMRDGLSTIRWHKLVSKVNALLHGKYTNLPGEVLDVKNQLTFEVAK
jgi:hypothetical protein